MADAKPTAPRAAAPRKIKMFTCELSTQHETQIPAGWTPFAVRPVDAHGGVPMAMIWAYK